MFPDGNTGVWFPQGDEFTAAEVVLANAVGVGRYDIVGRDVAVDEDKITVELTVRLYGDGSGPYSYAPLPED